MLEQQLSSTKSQAATNSVSPDFEQLQTQLATLRAKMERPRGAASVPFTPEELALFRSPEDRPARRRRPENPEPHAFRRA